MSARFLFCDASTSSTMGSDTSNISNEEQKYYYTNRTGMARHVFNRLWLFHRCFVLHHQLVILVVDL